jgi:hypothetical protein
MGKGNEYRERKQGKEAGKEAGKKIELKMMWQAHKGGVTVSLAQSGFDLIF